MSSQHKNVETGHVSITNLENSGGITKKSIRKSITDIYIY